MFLVKDMNPLGCQFLTEKLCIKIIQQTNKE